MCFTMLTSGRCPVTGQVLFWGCFFFLCCTKTLSLSLSLPIYKSKSAGCAGRAREGGSPAAGAGAAWCGSSCCQNGIGSRSSPETEGSPPPAREGFPGPTARGRVFVPGQALLSPSWRAPRPLQRFHEFPGGDGRLAPRSWPRLAPPLPHSPAFLI